MNDYIYEFDCPHGGGTIMMIKCKAVPPETYDFACPYGGGEWVTGVRSGPFLLGQIKDGKLGRIPGPSSWPIEEGGESQ